MQVIKEHSGVSKGRSEKGESENEPGSRTKPARPREGLALTRCVTRGWWDSRRAERVFWPCEERERSGWGERLWRVTSCWTPTARRVEGLADPATRATAGAVPYL